jgi:hypothetical protein
MDKLVIEVLLWFDNNGWKHELDRTNKFVVKFFLKFLGLFLSIYLDANI